MKGNWSFRKAAALQCSFLFCCKCTHNDSHGFTFIGFFKKCDFEFGIGWYDGYVQWAKLGEMGIF